jgi:hypothetical protein
MKEEAEEVESLVASHCVPREDAESDTPKEKEI